MKIQYVQGTPLFTKINKDFKQFNYLTEDIETDICVIGGGVTGAIVAYYLSKSNIPAVILEKKRIAHLSTSVTTSLLQYELDDNLSSLSDVTSIENGIKSYRLGLKALDEINTFIELYGNKCNYAKRDTLLYTSKPNEIKEIKDEYELRKNNNFDVSYVDNNNSDFSFDIKAGLISHNGGAEFDPFKFTHHLLEVSCNLGLRVFENTEVMDVKYNTDYVEVHTEYGHKIKCKKIIVATGYNTKLFTNRNFCEKTTTFNIVTNPISNIVGWNNNILIRDNNDPYNYLRTTTDNRLIIGGEDIPFKPHASDCSIYNSKYTILENHLKSMFPDIKNLNVDFKYCGTFGSTPDNLGFVGADLDNDKCWYCLGYGANGILFAVLGGMWLSDLYKGISNKDADLFRLDRFDN